MLELLILLVRENLQLLAIVFGFIGTFFTIRRQTKVFQTYVALEFFKRYSEISDAMPDRLRLAKYGAADNEPSNEEWRHVLRSMIRYGNLCSEEYALWQMGRIPKEIWQLWENGIRENFETEIWRRAWRSVAREYESYASFTGFMNRLIIEAEQVETRRMTTTAAREVTMAGNQAETVPTK